MVLALAAAASIGVAGTGAASPAEGKDLVVLGDSFSANAWMVDDHPVECRHGDTSWPTRLSKLMGVAGTANYADLSCPGASLDTPPSYTATTEAEQADQAGAFGPRTRLVALQFGLNDRWGTDDTTMWYALQHCVLDLVQGCGTEAIAQHRIVDPDKLTGEKYAERLRGVITYIKYYAPNARIVLVGYPEFFRTGQVSVCFNAFGVVNFVQPRGQAAIDAVDRLDRAQRDAAALLGVEFFNSRAVTAGHGLGTDQPWLNNFQDPRDPNAIPFHPTTRGDEAVATGIHDHLGG